MRAALAGCAAVAPAPQHIDSSLCLLERLTASDELFPTRSRAPFPARFDAELRRCARLVWHVLAHYTHAHWCALVSLHLHAQVVCFCAPDSASHDAQRMQVALLTHLYAYCVEFRLLDDKELALMHEGVAELQQRARPLQVVQHADAQMSSPAPRAAGSSLPTADSE